MQSEKATANGKSTGSFTLLAILEVLEVLEVLDVLMVLFLQFFMKVYSPISATAY